MIFTRREASSENQTLNFIEFCCESVEFAGFFHSKDNLTFSCFGRQPSVRVMKEKKEFRSLFSQKQSIIFRAKLNHQPFLLRTTHRRKNFHWMNDAPPIHEMPILERIRNAIWPPPGRHPHHHCFDRSRSQHFLSDLTRPKSDPGDFIISERLPASASRRSWMCGQTESWRPWSRRFFAEGGLKPDEWMVSSCTDPILHPCGFFLKRCVRVRVGAIIPRRNFHSFSCFHATNTVGLPWENLKPGRQLVAVKTRKSHNCPEMKKTTFFSV